MSRASFLEAVSIVSSTPAVVRSILQGLPASGLESSGEAWGARQVLEHLVDVEGIAFRERIGRIVEEDNPFIRSIDPPARLREGGFEQETLVALMDRFESLRAESVAWLQTLTPETLERTGTHEVAGTIGAGGLVHYWACHDLLHLRQLLRALQDRMEPNIANMVAFLETD